MRSIIYCIIFLLNTIIFISGCYNSCNVGFFENHTNIKTIKSFEISKPIINGGKCGYNHKFVLGYLNIDEKGDTIYPYMFSGFIYYKNNVIYLKQDDGSVIKYFDFNIKLNDSYIVNKFVNGRYNIHEFKLLMKFFDNKLIDTVYQFRIDNVGMFNDDSLLNLFITKKHGVIGVYIGSFDQINNREVIFYSFGKTYGYIKNFNGLIL